MTSPDSRAPDQAAPAPRVPRLQQLYDNVWLLFLISGLIVLLSYLVWAEDHASPAALSLLGVTLIINALAVLLAHRFQPPDPPVRL